MHTDNVSTRFASVGFESDDIGIMLLESITQGLYHEPLNSIREYIQNEFDAGATLIRVSIKDDTMMIAGNGHGMSLDDLMSSRRIGFSSKDPVHFVGFRGIGIWSGVAICDEILVSTKRAKQDTGHVLKIDAKGLRKDMESGELPLGEALSNRVFVKTLSRSEFSEKHGTGVELRGLLPQHMESVDKDSLVEYIGQVLPVRIDPKSRYSDQIEGGLSRRVTDYRTVRITVNDVEIFRPPFFDTETAEARFKNVKNAKGLTIAVAWYAIGDRGIRDPRSRFIVYKKKNFTVGDTSRSNVMVLRLKDRGALTWTTGEIHVLDEGIIPTSERIEFETNASLLELENGVSSLLDEIVKEVRIHGESQKAEYRLKEYADIKSRFLAATDRDERLDTYIEGKRQLGLFDQDLSSGRVNAPLKKEITHARKTLTSDLKFMANHFDAPAGTPTEEEVEVAKETRKRRTRVKKEEIPIEEYRKKIDAVFPFDRLSLRLFAAVIAALRRIVSEDKVDKFMEYLGEELKPR